MSKEITEEMRGLAIEAGKDPDTVGCWNCIDGVYALDYGMAPHRHVGKNIIGSTRMQPQSEWPANFEPDWDGIPEEERASYTGPMQGLWYCKNDCEYGGITKNSRLNPGPNPELVALGKLMEEEERRQRVPNEETLAAFAATEAGDRIKFESEEEMFRDLGI